MTVGTAPYSQRREGGRVAKFDAQWMEVRVVDRGHVPVKVVTVLIRRKCPKCRGGLRGRPWSVCWYERGVRIEVDRWDLSCRHVDLYCDVLRERR